MRPRLSRIVFFIFLGVALIPSARAQFYIRPRAGATLPVNGNDLSYSVGAAAGYQWTRILATELTYARLIGTGTAPDGDLVTGEAILGFPFPFLTPHLSGGAGIVHTSLGGSDDVDSLLLFGAGFTLKPILFLSLGGGVRYGAIFGGTDFFEPYLAVGLAF